MPGGGGLVIGMVSVSEETPRLGCPSMSVCCLEISLLRFPIMQMKNLESCSPLAWVVIWSRYLDKAFVEGEVVSDCVLPALLVLPVVGEIMQNIVEDTAQCELSFGAGTDSHYMIRAL